MHFILALSRLLRLLQHLLDNLLLLDQERTNDTVLDASGAAGATVGTADVLLGTGDLGVFTGTEGGNLKAIISLLLQNCHRSKTLRYCRFLLVSFIAPNTQYRHPYLRPSKYSGLLTPGSLVPQSPHLGAVPFFLI